MARLGSMASALAISALLVAACGDDDEGAAPASVSDAQAAVDEVSTLGDKPDNSEVPKAREPDGPYIGEYVAHLSEKQAEAAGDVELAGRSTLELRDDGTYSQSNELDGPSHGTYGESADGRLVFAHDNLCAVGGFDGKAVYTVELADDRLIFETDLAETGGCTGRTQALT
jgi:hypothetical protein